MPVFEFPYGDTVLPVKIPAEWIGEVVAPAPLCPAAEPAELIAAALAQPISASPLGQIARAGQTAAILLDDYTRQTPIHLLLPPVLRALLAGGLQPEDITLIIALGSHRPMRAGEIAARLSPEVQGRYRVINIPAENAEAMVYLGATASGVPVWVLRELVMADLRIGLGMITPHMDAGFSGGAKIVLPGACSLRTVDAFHALSATQPENALGNPEAPLRLELEQFVARYVPLHFIVNVVLTPEHQVYQCVAGDALAAHRVGVAHARRAYGAAVSRRYPLVVANCYPYQQDLWQSMKGLWCGELLTQEGGALTLLTHASEGLGNYPRLPAYIGQNPERLLEELRSDRTADPKSAATGILVGRMKQRIRLGLVSQGLRLEHARVMGFDWYPHPQAAITALAGRLPAAKRLAWIALIPQAGVTLPLLPG